MKVLLIGKNGQLAYELQATQPQHIELVCLGSSSLDISDAEAVAKAVAQHKPDVIINAAAYTAVDAAEQDRDTAYAVNAEGPSHLAQACLKHGCQLIHISTDFVFDGKAGTPYSPDSPTSPLGVYGGSKLAGEIAVKAVLDQQALIIRTAWVYSSHGNNFVKTMLRLMGDRDQLNVVADQVGTPTYAKGLAEFIWQAASKNLQGTLHWTDAGVCSWYDFAVAIETFGRELGLLDNTTTVLPIPASQYPTPAARPSYSVLDKAASYAALDDYSPIHWQAQLKDMMRLLAAAKD